MISIPRHTTPRALAALALSLGAIISWSAPARGEGEPPAPAPTPTAAPSPAPTEAPSSEESIAPRIMGSVYTTTAFGLSAVEGVPEGFNSSTYDLPVIVGAEVTLHGSRTGLDAWGDLHVGSAGYGIDPLFGAGFGLGFQSKLKEGLLAVRAGLALEDQATLKKAPVGGSYLDLWRWGLVAKGDYTIGIYEGFLAAKWWNTPTVTVSDFEDISTDVAWNNTYSLTLGARVHLPIVIAEASLSVYSLGAVAIASKEFDYFIGQQPVLQPGVGLGAEFGESKRWEAWLRFSRTYPVRNDDATEYLYQAPFYYDDNLMVRSLLTAEVRWKF